MQGFVSWRFPRLADVLGDGEDTDADDEVIIPSRRWSGRGLGEVGRTPRVTFRFCC